MKSRRETNTRFRLVLTLGLAVVLPALTLIFVNFQHVKSIQRDKKNEAIIHRDFQYLLVIAGKKINGKAYELTEQARAAFPSETDSDDEKRRKFDLLLSKSPWFAHAFLFDDKKGLTLRAQPGSLNDKQLADLTRILLQQGRRHEALIAAREAHDLFDALGGVEEGESQIRLQLAEALHANGDGDGARDAIRRAHDRLLERATKITDAGWRASFLENLPENARTLALAQAWLGEPGRAAQGV